MNSSQRPRRADDRRHLRGSPASAQQPGREREVKAGEVPEAWGDAEAKAKRSQKDTDARWTKKDNETHYGYVRVDLHVDVRIRSDIPIVPFTRRPETVRKTTLAASARLLSTSRTPISCRSTARWWRSLLKRRAVREGDVLIITRGDLRGSAGGTNGMKIVRVGELAPGSV